jgi:arylformamidase
MKWIFLSYFLGDDTPFYGGEGKFHKEMIRSLDKGDTCNTSKWSFPNHCGTHIDLPRHFVAEGKCLDDYKPDFWLFNNVSFIKLPDLQPASNIGPELFDKCQLSEASDLILLKTGFGSYRNSHLYWQKSPVFCPELADYFRTRFPSLRAFGFDSISVSSWTDRITGRAAHRAFLGGERPILLIEDMDLSLINEFSNLSSVIVSPMLVRGTDATPCTIIAEVTDI